MASQVTDFTQPQYVDEVIAGDESIDTGIDLNDPNLLADEMDANVDKDPYAAPPPLPDGFWKVKIKQLKVKGPNNEERDFNVKTDKQSKKYAYTALELQVQQPGGQFDGQKLNDYFLSTMQQKNGGIPVVRVLNVLGVKIPQKVNAQWLMDTLKSALAGEPDLVIETVWEGGLNQDDKKRFDEHVPPVKFRSVLGSHRFPLLADGSRSPELKVSTALGEVVVRARPRVNGYYDKDHETSIKKV